MTSGNVTSVVGPNDSTGAGISDDLAGNVLLNTLVPGFTTFDASVINLTFIPEGQTLQFSYVFGSEDSADESTARSTTSSDSLSTAPTSPCFREPPLPYR